MQTSRESIFKGAVRNFFSAFAIILGIMIAIIAVIMLCVFASASQCSLAPKSSCVILPDGDGHRSLLNFSDPAILQLDIHGVIGVGNLTGKIFNNLLYDSREDHLSNNRVKAIILHIDTPGGTVTDADDIYRGLMAYKKKYNVPVYAYIDGMCASGGMYVASAADKVYASPSSVIGSVGVILGPNFNFSEAMTKIGVSSLTITEGKDKDSLNPFRPWKAGEEDSIRAVIAYLYDHFVNIVVQGRPRIEKQKLIQDYGAHIFDPVKAQELGYIDVAGTDMSTALKDLVHAANIGEGKGYQLVQLQPPSSLFSDLAGGNLSLFKGKITHTFQIGPHLNSDMSGKFLYLYQP
jgi:signal peptide peptidase SppA